MKIFPKYKKAVVLVALGVIVGGAAGFAYWKFVGCTSGTCPIWSRPGNSIAYGSMLGVLLFLSVAPGSSGRK